MNIRIALEMVDMGEETIAVPVGEGAEQVRGVLKLNRSGREIVELLATPTTKESVVDQLAANFDNDRLTLASYVDTVLAALSSLGLLVD